MGVYIRDSPYFWLTLDGYKDERGNPLREPTKILHGTRPDRYAPMTPEQVKRNRDLAHQVYHGRMYELARGTTIDADKLPSITFGDFLDWWVETKLPHRRGKEREAHTVPRLRTAFGAYPVGAIDRRLVETWITVRLKTPTVITQGPHERRVMAGPKTVNREVDLLKAILKAAVPEYLKASPLYGMPKLRVTAPKRRLMTPDEEKRLLAVMADDDKAIFLLALDALVRLTDCLDVTRQDDHGETIWIADPKVGDGFEVPVSRRLRRALDVVETDPKGSEYLFWRRRLAETERDRRGTIRSALKRYCRLADLPYGRTTGGLTFHWATRRTGATRMLTRKVDLGTVQKVGGWKTPDVVLSIYHGLIDEAARAAVESVSRRPRRVQPRGRKRPTSGPRPAHAATATRRKKQQK